MRRIKTDWRTHLNYYLQFNLFSWQYKVGFGGRVVPTKRKPPGPRAVTFTPPAGSIEPSKLVDEEAEAVKQKAVEERKEEQESSSMAKHDRPQNVQHEVRFADEVEFQEETAKNPAPSTPAPEVGDASMPSSSAPAPLQAPMDPGAMAPVTPQDFPVSTGDSPRHSATTRVHGPEGDELESKRAKVDEPKKQRINALSAEHASMVRAISFGEETYHTLDNYDTELQDDGCKRSDKDEMDDLWKDEEELYFAGIPEALWHDGDLKVTPCSPDDWIEQLADQVEISRLLEMKVLVRKEEYNDNVLGSLTTKFVRDWRVKLYVDEGGNSRMRWMRRSRFVAREFAVDRRDDTYSPATGAHTTSLLPLRFLQLQQEAKEGGNQYQPLLAALDIKDAFLQVPQDNPIEVELQGQKYVICRNLPGQRQGSRSWYWHFRDFLCDKLQFEFCIEQPCVARVPEATLLIHVDDVLYCGSSDFFHKKFLPCCQEQFTLSWSALGEVGSSITFLKKKFVATTTGIMVVPGTDVKSIVETFETHFGKVKNQTIPCDSSIQLEDVSQPLSQTDAGWYRSVVGSCLYLGRDRPDLVFTIKELASRMAKPTLNALQHLRKMVGYLRTTGELGISLHAPVAGQGKWKTCVDKFWILETYSDADWASNKGHRKSTSCSIHFLNGSYVFGAARTQRVIALSSCESELHSIVSGMCDAIYIRRVLEFMLNVQILQVHYTDSSSARQLVARQGCGKIRHLSGKILWVQSKVKDKEVELIQVPTSLNVSDIGTKALSKKRLFGLMSEAGMIYVESGEIVGESELAEIQDQYETAKSTSKVAKAILRVSLMLGLGPSGANAMSQEEQQCALDAGNGGAETTWIWIFVILLFMLWIGFAFTAFWFWRRINERFTNNELQLAQGDTYMWRNREDINTERTNHDQLVRQFNAFVERTDGEVNMLEEYIDCVRDGLVNYGGFVRYTNMDRQQRDSMFTQERANGVLFRMRQREPDVTDPPVSHPNAASSSGLTRPTVSSSTTDPATAGPPTTLRDTPMVEGEGGEEESPTTDDDMGDANPDTREGHLTQLVHHLKGQLNTALANEMWEDAGEINVTIQAVLDSAGASTTLTMDLAQRVQSTFQRLRRRANNRGDRMVSELYREFAENLNSYV